MNDLLSYFGVSIVRSDDILISLYKLTCEFFDIGYYGI